MSNICQECGMNVEPGEFHPYEFCILWKNGQDPRSLYQRIVDHNKAQKPKQPEWLSQALDDYESMVLSDVYGQIRHLRAALEQLIEDYKRRIRSAITMIEDPEVRVEQKTRIQVKKATYQTLINEIEGIMNDEAPSIATEPTEAERVREPVAWFAQQMEAKLRENDHKGGWQDCSLAWLVERLYQEAKELWIEVDRVVPEPERIIREAADVANFAMMIADIARRINDNP